MDDIVKAALLKWPNVPHCTGWLALDGRGDWYMRDDRAQAAGPFPQSKGSRIRHDKLRSFIERNYESDAEGCWFFQNGPQRVYVELEAAPWILGVQHLDSGWVLQSHCGDPFGPVEAAWLDDRGRLFLAGRKGLGLVRSADMDCAADAVLAGLWKPEDCRFEDLPQRYGYRLSPHSRQRDGVSPQRMTAGSP